MCERVCFRDWCKVPRPISRCVRAVHTKLRPPKPQEQAPVVHNGSFPITTNSQTHYVGANSATEYTATSTTQHTAVSAPPQYSDTNTQYMVNVQ